MKIKFIRFNLAARLPERKHYNDTGADIYMLTGGQIEPHQTIVVPLGFGIDLPDGHNARLQVRTSIAKQGIHIHSCAIDAGYKGELNMIITNMSNTIFTWKPDDRLGYIEVYPCVYADIVEELGDERNDGAFGSTNTVLVER